MSTPGKRPRLASTGYTPSSLSANFACKRCRSRKVKCDLELPSCVGCAKANVPCIVADYSTAQEHTRAEVHALEQRLAELEMLLSSKTNDGNDGNESIPGHTPTSLRRNSDSSRFVGPESGINFIQPIFDAMRRQTDSQRRIRSQGPSIEYQAPHPLPCREIALRALRDYSEEFHVCHPFLDKARIRTVLDTIYTEIDSYRASSTLSKLQRHDLFQLNMVLAIGSIRRYRERDMHTALHPFGFFTAALDLNPLSECSFGTIEDVENLLLISLFGVYYNIGCSIWELGRLSIRICIELQLHRHQSSSGPGRPDDETQRRERVFWDCYLLDRFSSSILGRPFAIDESVIEIDLPNKTAEHMDVFAHLVRLGRITSTMHISMYYSNLASEASLDSPQAAHVDARNIFSHLRNFHAQLESWRLQAPTFNASTCFYETCEFFEMTFHESRLWLFRAAVNNLPPELSRVREKLLQLCLHAAMHIVRCYNDLWKNSLATCSLPFTRLILISGMVTVSVTKLQASSPSRLGKSNASGEVEEEEEDDDDIDCWLGELGLGSPPGYPSPSASRETLEATAKILFWLAIQMPDISAYSQFFEMLKRDAVLTDQDAAESNAGGRLFSDGYNEGFMHTLADSTGSVTGAERRRAEPLFLHGSGRQVGGWDGSSDFGLAAHGAADDTTADTLHSDLFSRDHPMLGNYISDLLRDEPFQPFPHSNWVEGIDDDISGFIWDTVVPWQGSPFTNT